VPSAPFAKVRTAAYPGLDRTVLVHGERGSIVAEDDLLVRWRIMADSPDAEKEEERAMLARFGKKEHRESSTASDPFAFATRGHLLQFEALADSIRNDTAPPNSIETSRHTVEILNAVYESGRTGKAVRVGVG
jgi:UDP-N-acetyl-2-amino-2-deoxyglucuronate dehydrogenase